MNKSLHFLLLCVTVSTVIGSPPVMGQGVMAYASTSQTEPAILKRKFSETKTELRHELKLVESRYKVSFMYSAELKDMVISNKFDPSIKSVSRQLDNLVKGTSLAYKKISENFYVITRSRDQVSNDYQNAMDGLIAVSDGQYVTENFVADSESRNIQLTVSGKVVDQNNEALPGVNVVLKGTSVGTVTNADGVYSLAVADDQSNGTLVFSFIGYMTKEEAIAGRTSINITLDTDTKQLEEVVVVGYGTQKTESVTGAISTVSSKDISALPVVSVEAAMQGRMPGVSVVNNGSPGEAPIVRIRGIGSLTYASNPLYVVDGFPIQSINGINGGIGAGSQFPAAGLNNFDTKDIESVSVLKDASASAIYGSRAANGVIMITTKKGKNDGKIHATVDSFYGWQKPWKTLDLLDTEGYIQYATALRTNAGNGLPSRFGALDDVIYSGTTQTYRQTHTDWQKEVFRTAPITQTQLSLTGGNDISKVYSSVSYMKQEGIMVGTGYERVSFRVNSDHTLKRFTFGQTLSLSYDNKLNENNSSGRTQIQHMIRQLPYIPVKDPTKIGGYRSADNGNDGADPENPVRVALQDQNKIQGLRLMGTAYAQLNLFKGFDYRFTAGVDMMNNDRRIFSPVYNDGFNGRDNSTLSLNEYHNLSTLFSNQLTYDRTFGKHYVNVVAVAEQQDVLVRGLFTQGQYVHNELSEGNGLSAMNVNSRRFETTLYSYVGRVNYEYQGKYLLSASLRRDGSSVFAPGKKWGNFPAASVGWRLSEEAFLKGVPAISELKARVSYGLLGFNGIGPYDWQAVQSSSTNVILGGNTQLGSFTNQLGNLDMQWEKTTMFNAGVDLGLFANKITFSAEYYNRLVDNLLLQTPIIPSSGYAASPIKNIGEMKNWGYELQAGYNKSTGDFKWNLTGNFSVTRNKVLQLETDGSVYYAGSIADYGYQITRTEKGQSVQGFYGYKTDGLFQSNEEALAAPRQNIPTDPSSYDPKKHTAAGDVKFKDISGPSGTPDGVIDSYDQTYLGSFLPKFSYGLNFSGTYKNFDITLFFQGVQGNKVYNVTKFYTQGMLRLFNAGTETLDAWSPSNTNTDVPRAIDGDPNLNVRNSDRFIESGSYLRLKNLSIGFSVPSSVLTSLTKNTIAKARVYVASQNLFTITKYSGYDPEIGARGLGVTGVGTPNGQFTGGIDYGQFPQARTFMVGVQVGF